MSWRATLENIATLLITGATIACLHAYGAGSHSFWPLLMLLNLNYPKSRPD